MKTDYTYCLSDDCIHRRGCKRWVGNYKDEKRTKLYQNLSTYYVFDKDCKDNSFVLLDRFRNSDVEE